jgi:uncharacterized membrane protein YfcA
MPGIEHLTIGTLVLVSSIFLFAGLVHGTLGLGFPMMATPLLAMMTDVRSAILITLLPTIAVNIVSILKGGRWRESIGKYWPLALYICVGSMIGTLLLIVTDPAPFKLLLATIIVLYLNTDRFNEIQLLHWIKSHPPLALIPFGLMAGFSAGTVNVMVPILIILFLELEVTPIAMVQVFNMSFFTGKITQVAMFTYTGTLTADIFLVTAPFAVVGVAALVAGMTLRAKVAANTYRGWMKKVLWVVALVLVGQFFVQN